MLTARQQLDNLADALIEDIMNLSDDEVLAEFEHDRQYRAQVTARAGVVQHRGIAYAVTWDVCPFCGQEGTT